ncbi:MAG: hypothetical protein ACREOF_07795 [Gemmatimonadales bacterium]
MHRIYPIILLGVLPACTAGGAAPSPAPLNYRKVELFRSLSLTGVAYAIAIVDSDRTTKGAFKVYSGDANRTVVERDFGCVMGRASEQPRFWTCEVPVPLDQRAWQALLAQLDGAGMMEPPSNVPAGWDSALLPMVVCNDGSPWRLVVRDTAGTTLVQDQEECDVRTVERKQYQLAVRAVVDRIVGAARLHSRAN